MTETKGRGRIAVVGFGSGSLEDMTPRAVAAIKEADLVVGYKTYIDILEEFFPKANYFATPMTKEIARCEYAVDKALEGNYVALVSSGDSGIYGMAGILLEIAGRRTVAAGTAALPIDVVPGITAASSAAALLGAPLTHDFAVISLSDLMTPLDLIYERVEAAAKADFVICLYNPRSKKRKDYLDHSCEIIQRYRPASTPCGVARHIGREEESTELTTLGELAGLEVDMFSTIIIGNSQTRVENGYLITPRGYVEKYLVEK